VRYVHRSNVGRMIPDYRGGLSFGKSFGRNFGGESKGVFFETNADAVYVSRFDDDTIFYSQNRAGYTAPALGPMQAQLLWNFNGTADLKRQYWANFTEQGPGIRIRLINGLMLSASALNGRYTVLRDNPRAPKFNDLRIGLWYAFTH
jgi:hypothetical protein